MKKRLPLFEKFSKNNIDITEKSGGIPRSILKDMQAFGLSENDIDKDGFVTLFHGGKKLPTKLNKDEIFFMTPDEHEAKDYADMRNGEVFTLRVKPVDVNWNQGSYEVEFDKGGIIKNGTIIPENTKNTNTNTNIADYTDPWNTKKDYRGVSNYKGVKVGDKLPKTKSEVIDIVQFKRGNAQFQTADGWFDADTVVAYEFK